MITLPPIKIAQGEPFSYSARVTGQSWVGYTGRVVFRPKRRATQVAFKWNGFSYMGSTDPIVTAVVTGDATGLLTFSLTSAQTLTFPTVNSSLSQVTSRGEITMGNGVDAKKYQFSVAVTESLDTVIQPGSGGGGGGVVTPPVEPPVEPPVPPSVAPAVNTVAPVTTGSGKIGSAHTITTGTWTGAFSYQYRWQRSGVTIAGANAASYTPVAADNLTTLVGQVAAFSVDNVLSAYVSSNAYAITYEAPIAAGSIANVTWTQNTAIAAIATIDRFTGSALVYSYAPAVPGITINSASGLISGTPTTAAAGVLLTVTATNSGGSATRTFTATVAAATGTAPAISNILLNGDQVTFDMVEPSSYPVTIYYAVEATATVLTGQALDDLVVAGTSPVEGTVNVTAAGQTVVSPNWAAMTTGSTWYFKVAARNAAGFINASSLVYGPFDWDAVAPLLTSSVPADNAIGVSTSADIVLTFNKSILAETGNIVLRQNIATVWSDVETFAVPGQVSISGSTVTINPTSALVGGREYAVRIDAGALANLSGINYAGIANDTALSFTAGAAGAFVYDAIKGSGESFSTSLVVSLSGIAASQRLFAILTTRGTNNVTVPAGWTLYQRAGAAAGKSGFTPSGPTGTEIIVYTKTAVGGESSITFTGDVFVNFSATVLAFTGTGIVGETWAATAFPFAATSVTTGVTASTDAYVLSIFTADQDTFVATAPAGVTVLTTASPATLPRDGHMICMEGPVVAGATATRTATMSASSFFNRCTIELEP